MIRPEGLAVNNVQLGVVGLLAHPGHALRGPPHLPRQAAHDDGLAAGPQHLEQPAGGAVPETRLGGAAAAAGRAGHRRPCVPRSSASRCKLGCTDDLATRMAAGRWAHARCGQCKHGVVPQDAPHRTVRAYCWWLGWKWLTCGVHKKSWPPPCAAHRGSASSRALGQAEARPPGPRQPPGSQRTMP
jgi:hypothetical protein